MLAPRALACSSAYSNARIDPSLKSMPTTIQRVRAITLLRSSAT
jgi:hypothetical protein